MTTLSAAAARRTMEARRCLAAGSAAVLCMLWLFGAGGLPLPAGIDPRVNPSGHASAQLLLFLLTLPASARILRGGAQALAARRPDAAAALLVSVSAGLADSLLLTVRIAFAVGDGAHATAERLATELPLALLGGTLAAVSFAARHGELPKSRITAHACRVLLPCEAALAALTGGVVWLRLADAATAVHAALLVPAVCTPASLLLAAPLLMSAAGKSLPAALSCEGLERLGTAAALCFTDAALRQEALSLFDLYTVTGNKPALLATAAALAAGADDAHAGALVSAAASLGLRLPRAERARHVHAGFGGTVHRRTWRFSTENAAVPELIRRTDFGGGQPLYAFVDGRFRGVLLFAKAQCPDADAALDCLRACGVEVSVPAAAGKQAASFLSSSRENVLHVAREGATIRLTDADGHAICLNAAAPAALAAAVWHGRRVTAALRTAVGISAAAALFCIVAVYGVCISAGAAALTSAAAIRLSAMVTVLLLSLFVRRAAPPEISSEEERPAMFGKVNYTIHVEGMSCSHCAAHVKTALEAIRGVSADVVLDEKIAHVKCPSALDEKQLVDAVTDAGFTVASIARV